MTLEKKLTGTYPGTLQQVVTHVLRGYVVKSGEKGIEITLLGTGKAVAVVGAAPAKAAVRRVEATAEPLPATNAADQPVPVPVASSAGPLPVIKVAEGPPPVPAATPPASGSAPTPVPGTGAAAAPSPAPPAPGSVPSPVPTPGTGSATLVPPPVAGMTSRAGPPLATAPTAEPAAR